MAKNPRRCLVIPGRAEGASPDSSDTHRAAGFRIAGLRPASGMTDRVSRKGGLGASFILVTCLQFAYLAKCDTANCARDERLRALLSCGGSPRNEGLNFRLCHSHVHASLQIP